MGSEIFVLVILIVLNAFFAASEIALISLNDNKIKQLADNGDKKAKMLYQLLSEPSRFLATIQIGITLAGFLASAFAAGSFAGRLTEAFLKMGVTIPRNMLETVSVVIITLILSYFTLVLGELVPKRLALQKAEAISMFAVVPLTVLLRVSSPFVKLLTFSTNTIVRLFGVDPNKEKQGVTEEEIRLLVNIGKEKGTIQEAEKVMINNIFEFDNKSVSDIMTHRTNIVGIPINFSLLQTVQLVNVERYTRYPVYEESIDNIIGILHVKDLIQFVEDCDENRFNLKELIREPVLVLETKRIDDLLREMQMNNVHIAIAIDEYGGTDGMVTIEDVIEEIVGNIFDEYDDPEMAVEEIIELKENTYLVAGTTSLYEVENILNLQLPIHEFDTISGFVLDQLGYIPDVIEKPAIEYNNYLFKVDEMHEKRIMSIQISENCVDRQGEI